MGYKVNALGSLVPDTSVVSLVSSTSNAGMTAGNKVLWKDALGNVEVFDGTEAHAHLICGVSDGNAVAAGGTCSYMPVNGILENLNPFFPIPTGELFAKDDGSLCAVGSLVPNKFTRRIGTLSKNDGTTLYLDFDTVYQVP